MATEFLPICDNLFNVISLAAYFCDCVFDLVLAYALLERGRINFFIAVVFIISGSLLVSQIVSLKWYFKSRKLHKLAIESETVENNANQEQDESECPKSKLIKYSVIGIHVTQLSVIWRYAKLFVPVDLRFVKYEVRDLCILRLIHAFCEAAPMLCISSYILITLQNNEESSINPIKIKTLGGQLSTHLVQQSTIIHQYREKTFKDLNTISAILSLFSVCWALGSFSKNVSKHNVHRLVLTWLGVIFQFFWRLGTIISRVLSLTVYASVYKKYIFLVIVLHWISMFLWLISPKNAFHGEQISRLKKMLLSGLVAFIYIFAYINLQEANHRQKMTIFYIVMFLENCLLVSLWIVGIPERPNDWYIIPLYVLGTFIFGIIVMIIYYKYFHIRRLGYETDSNVDGTDTYNKCIPYGCRCNQSKFGSKYSSIFSDGSFHHKKEEGKGKHNHATTNEHLKGIFNCRFSNPVHNATKRKKKKPTTFIPPPNLNLQANINMNCINMNNPNICQSTNSAQPHINNNSNNINGPMTIPFWRQPLPRNSMTGSSETEGSVASSRINIQLKLQEKKQKQLAELKIIEEEIKQGKLGRASKLPHENDESENILPRLPAPRAKKHIDIETIDFRRNSSCSEADNMNILLYQLQQNNSEMMYNNFSSNNGSIAAALTKFSHEILSNISIGESAKNNSSNINLNTNTKQQQPSASSTMTSTTSENENNSLTRQMVSTRKKLLHQNLANNLNSVRASPSRIGSPSCHYEHRQSAYNSLEGKSKTDTNRSSNSKNENSGSNSNVNTSSMEKEKNLASQLIKRQMARANTPEIILAPSHLENNTHNHFYQHINQIPSRNENNAYMNESIYRSGNNFPNNGIGYERASIHMEDDDESPNVASDIDSQMSLPRSYTLPREFKFNRQGRKIIKNENFITSTNSSDGDVDSCDDNEDDDDSRKMPSSQRTRNRRTNNLNKNRIHSPFNNMSPNIVTQQQYQNSYNMRGHQGNLKVNNLDLINDCIDNIQSGQQHIVSNLKQSRGRAFMQNAYNHNRHETKL
ncbi:hypothetical protein PVAND_008268 [Polypedilum vanderplanki]|uniref:XK-related protein n=1 Tax=Polypedilum vanderplanki TaxID=319348 RepID=A0A9J6C9G4_POLVA|nr:hypothetical protein PVAND_008268 [Polypedilum vanderplanki]